MTVNEVVKRSVAELESIRIPAAETEEIGIPVYRVIANLRKCIGFMDQVEREEARKAAGAENGEPEKTEKEVDDHDERPDV